SELFDTSQPGARQPALAEHPAGQAFLRELRAFLDGYGHRETLISTALQPTWKDAPELVLGIIQGFAAHPPPAQDSSPAWQAAQAELLQHPLLRVGLLRAAFRANLAKARTLLQMREDTHFYATLPLPLFRRVSLELGRRLTAAGALRSPEDVFHLRLSELERVGAALDDQSDGHSLPPDLARELHAAAARRMAARAALEHTPLVDPRLNPEPALQGDELLRGMPGSPGVAEGPARIVQSGAEFDRLAAGDVLVAPFTNPSWTPLFQRAAAVVVDTGSPVSHAAIVAREYGIPAVMATGTGTRALRDGERVRVDGGRGVVYRLDPEEQAAEG
ncbi:MAG TPA: PEP-utilizing enzyme, partial [Anaerolineaceae bacterium]|nr:PEP-utilizing enzyme [Anaerolineaceae bacterium]